jgi:hypothetical protein
VVFIRRKIIGEEETNRIASRGQKKKRQSKGRSSLRTKDLKTLYTSFFLKRNI